MNHDVLELVDTNGIDRAGSDQRRPDRHEHDHRDPRRLRHDRDHDARYRDRRESDRQLAARLRSQSDRPDHDRGLPDAILPDLPVPGTDRRLGPDGSSPGDAGRDSKPVRLQHDDPAPEHGRRHREHLLLRDRAGAERRRRDDRQDERPAVHPAVRTTSARRPRPPRPTPRPTARPT